MRPVWQVSDTLGCVFSGEENVSIFLESKFDSVDEENAYLYWVCDLLNAGVDALYGKGESDG